MVVTMCLPGTQTPGTEPGLHSRAHGSAQGGACAAPGRVINLRGEALLCVCIPGSGPQMWELERSCWRASAHPHALGAACRVLQGSWLAALRTESASRKETQGNSETRMLLQKLSAEACPLWDVSVTGLSGGHSCPLGTPRIPPRP